MLNLNSFAKLGLFIYINFYLIYPKLAITQNTNVDIRKNLENALNNQNFESIKNNFKNEESLKIQAKFTKIIKESKENPHPPRIGIPNPNQKPRNLCLASLLTKIDI